MRTFAEQSLQVVADLLDEDPNDPRYRALLVRRTTYLGALRTVGTLILEPELRRVVHLCRTGHARPADRRTELDVALALEFDRVPR